MNTRIIYYPNGATINGVSDAVMQVYLLNYAGIAAICFGLNWLVQFAALRWVNIGMLAWVIVPVAVLLSAALLLISVVGFSHIQATSVKVLYSFGLPLATVYVDLDYLRLPLISQLISSLPVSYLKAHPTLADMAVDGVALPLFQLNYLAQSVTGGTSIGVAIYTLAAAAMLFGIFKLLCLNANVLKVVKWLFIIGFVLSFTELWWGFVRHLLFTAGWGS
ncbi:hypothetical protein [Shewanella sp.]|uniref:hypothetical protein n=1 Tax=Shewanella sp. TaxID=50422 RepID=UPI003A987D6B